MKYQVKWESYSSKYNTWEPESTLAGTLAAIVQLEEKIKIEDVKTN